MSKTNYFPKPLKGGNSIADILDENDLNDNILSILNSGIDLNNVNITGGTIDGVIIGGNQPVIGNFTNITVTQNSSLNTITDLQSITFQNLSTISQNSTDIVIDSIGNTVIESQLNVNNDTVITGDLTVIGTITGVPASPPAGYTLEHISTTIPTNLNPSNSINISYLTFSGTGSCSGTLQVPSFDGFLKLITIINIPSGSSYELTVENLLDPESSTISNKILTFYYSGQGVNLLYSLPDNCYIFSPGGHI